MEEIKIEMNNEKLVLLRARNRELVQAELEKIMIGEHAGLKTELDWVNHYSKLVSKIIDNPENAELRDKIMQEKYLEAAILIKDTLEDLEHQGNKAA